MTGDAQAATTGGPPQAASGSAPPVPLAPPDRQPPDLKVPTRVARKAGWAIVGLGELALEEIMPAFKEARLSRPVALVSGHAAKAQQVAGAYDIEPKAIYDYANFDRIADNPEIDVVYIVLPNSMHAEFTIRALKAGKHVLCEKPMAPTTAECERMIAAAGEAGRKLMIAYRMHYEPLNRKVAELCAQKAYGRVKTFASSNCQDTKAPNIRFSKELAGGPIGDVGIYSINAARYAIGEEPVSVTAFSHHPPDDPRFREVPESVVYTLKYPSGAMAHGDCSFGSSTSRHYHVHCAKGVISMDPAFDYRGLRLFVKEDGEQAGAANKTEIVLPAVNQFAAEMDHFSDCVIAGRDPRTPGALGLADMRIVEALYEAIRTGGPVSVAR